MEVSLDDLTWSDASQCGYGPIDDLSSVEGVWRLVDRGRWHMRSTKAMSFIQLKHGKGQKYW
jgi:hypothetical protein